MPSGGEIIVKPSLIDTNILSMFFKNHPIVISHFKSYLSEYPSINLSILTYFEIVSGLKHRDAQHLLTRFSAFVKRNTLLHLTEQSVLISGDLYAQLRKTGNPIDDIDLLIAGIAIENKLVLITNNRKHFERIPQLEIMDWSIDS